MFRTIAMMLTVASALSASFALAGDYMFRGDAYGSYGGRYETDYCEDDDYNDKDCHIDYVEQCRHKTRYVEQVFVKPACTKPAYCEPVYCKPAYCEPIRRKQVCVEPIRVQKVCVEPIRVRQYHVQPVHVKQVCVEPVYVKQVHVERQCVKPVHVEQVCVEPQTYCYYKICYKNPCWDYQKDMTFDCVDEAKEMCHVLQSKGYRIALLKCDDGYGRGERGGDNFEVGYHGQGKMANSGRGFSEDFLLD